MAMGKAKSWGEGEMVTCMFWESEMRSLKPGHETSSFIRKGADQDCFDLMRPQLNALSRRAFLARAALAGGGICCGGAISAKDQEKEAAHANKALIAMTLDLEMARNFPRWEDTHWDY